jgi:transposase
LRQQAKEGKIILAYVDESGFTATSPNRYAWTPRGEVHRTTAAHQQRVNVIGALLSTSNFMTSCLRHSVTGTWVYGFITGLCQRVKERYDKPLVIILDNASFHKAKQTLFWRRYLEDEYGVRLYFLPPYSPELNRIEMVWKKMKYQWRSFQVMTTQQIEEWVCKLSCEFGKHYMFNF